jgi:hypothetical protein
LYYLNKLSSIFDGDVTWHDMWCDVIFCLDVHKQTFSRACMNTPSLIRMGRNPRTEPTAPINPYLVLRIWKHIILLHVKPRKSFFFLFFFK